LRILKGLFSKSLLSQGFGDEVPDISCPFYGALRRLLALLSSFTRFFFDHVGAKKKLSKKKPPAQGAALQPAKPPF